MSNLSNPCVFPRREVAATRQVGLAEAIEQLRDELGKAQDAGADQQLRFEITEVELELLVELRVEAGPDFKANFGVVSAGVGAKADQARAHTLRLKMNVRDEALGGRRAELSDMTRRSFQDRAPAASEHPEGTAES